MRPGAAHCPTGVMRHLLRIPGQRRSRAEAQARFAQARARAVQTATRQQQC